MNVGTNSAPWAYEDSTVTSNGNGTTKIQYAAAGYGFYFMTAWREHSAELKIKIKVDNAGKYIPMVNIHGRGNYDRPVPITASLLNGSTELASKHINTAAYGSMNHYVALSDTPVELAAGEYTAKFNVDMVCGYAIVDGFKLVAADSAVATFKDVDPSKYYATPVGIAKTLDIVGGVNAHDFAPTAPITRQDMMVIIYRALKAAGIEIEKTATPTFSDASAVAAYASAAVEALTGAGLIAGSNGKINPKANTTRAEVAVVLDRILNK